MGYYDEFAPGYDELHRAEQERKLGRIIVLAQGQTLLEGAVLDVGCGTGFGLDLVAAALRRPCTGIEPSTGMRKQYRGEQEIIQGRAEALPFPGETFAAGVSVTSVQNFADPAQGLQELWRVVKKGGFVFVSCLKQSNALKTVVGVLGDLFTVLSVEEDRHDLIFVCKKEAFK
ncbi:class I SAM-dependent methyltransferase [Candidatus Woesearchaeota archaeon]|nr:class I SAM-dependent methyltransferase [Candidatus Woesearchaeota archaeon]